MRFLLSGFMLIAGISPACACDLEAISTALAAPLADMKPLEREVSDVQSTEGGIWEIYREADGRVHTILRTDGGESGKLETRLSTVNRKTWGIAKTRFDYIRHAFIEDSPFAIVRTETQYYFFCDGKPYLPPPEASTLDNAQYEKDANEVRASVLGAKEIADFTKGLK